MRLTVHRGTGLTRPLKEGHRCSPVWGSWASRISSRNHVKNSDSPNSRGSMPVSRVNSASFNIATPVGVGVGARGGLPPLAGYITAHRNRIPYRRGFPRTRDRVRLPPLPGGTVVSSRRNSWLLQGVKGKGYRRDPSVEGPGRHPLRRGGYRCYSASYSVAPERGASSHRSWNRGACITDFNSRRAAISLSAHAGVSTKITTPSETTSGSDLQYVRSSTFTPPPNTLYPIDISQVLGWILTRVATSTLLRLTLLPLTLTLVLMTHTPIEG